MTDRVIKYRAWDKDEKFMLSWDMLRKQNLNYNQDFKGCKNRDSYGSVGISDIWIDDDLEIMEYTGLHDKDGREIYEGDIVEYTKRKGRQPVGARHVVRHTSYWENDIYHRNPQYSGFGVSVDYSLTYSFSQSGIRVIGNIHENPELLEE